MITEFDKLFAVSDLHLGGKLGRQAFREKDALSWLIDQARTDNATRVALLLNGDIFDFLADPAEAQEFNLSADRILRTIAEDEAFKPIFDALRNFVNKPNRTLIVQVGNHDVELALPQVAAALVKVLSPPPSPPSALQILIESSGMGWTCRVGDRVVLAVHGNAEDPWNEVDHATLARVVRTLEFGDIPVQLPATNAGTTLVINVMNAVKEKYPFVDLLKPEDAPLMAVLQAVNARQSVTGLLKALRIRAAKGELRELLSEDEAPSRARTPGAMGEMLDFVSGVSIPAQGSQEALRRAERSFRDGDTPRKLATNPSEKLGLAYDFGRVELQRLQTRLDRLKDAPEDAALRLALRRWLARDKSFDIRAMSNIDSRIARSASRGVEVLIAGHTHLAREVQDMRILSADPRTYLNTGTWMRVLKLQGSPYLESDAEFSKFMTAVRAGSLEALDALNIDVRARPVAIVDASGGRLWSVQDRPAGDPPFHLVPLADVAP